SRWASSLLTTRFSLCRRQSNRNPANPESYMQNESRRLANGGVPRPPLGNFFDVTTMLQKCEREIHLVSH
ncbi:hypothetical protein PMAYCL1PPCAC_06131, partial [Pristionchus mayeri]